MLNGLADHDQ